MKRVIRNSSRLADKKQKHKEYISGQSKSNWDLLLVWKVSCSGSHVHLLWPTDWWGQPRPLLNHLHPVFFLSNDKIKNQNDCLTPNIIEDRPSRVWQRRRSGSRPLRPRTGSFWKRQAQWQPSGPSAPERLIWFPWRRSGKTGTARKD